MLMTATDELENGYMTVLRGIEDTCATVERAQYKARLGLSNKSLNDCIERLDNYAENLHQLDERLSSIADHAGDEDVMERIRDLPKYSALMQLGTAIYDRLFKDYSKVSKLRDRRIFIRLSLIGVSMIVISMLMLASIF